MGADGLDSPCFQAADSGFCGIPHLAAPPIPCLRWRLQLGWKRTDAVITTSPSVHDSHSEVLVKCIHGLRR